jgi:uncharacterized protein
MAGETKLQEAVNNLQPHLHPQPYVFVQVADNSLVPRTVVWAEIKEKEGITMILQQHQADYYNLVYEFVASRITLQVNSSLELVGLTAKVAYALARKNISCNVIAAFCHDHVFVPVNQGEEALAIISALANKNY